MKCKRNWDFTLKLAEPIVKNRKICFLMGSFYPTVNGAITQVTALSERMLEKGSSVLVIAARTNAIQPSYEKWDGIEVIRVSPTIELKKPIGKYIRLFPTFLALVNAREKYDLIIASDFSVRGPIAVIASKILKKKCFLKAESNGEMDGSFATQFGSPAGRWKVALIRILVVLRNGILKKADGFISISSAISREYIKSGIRRNALFDIPNGVDVKRFSPVDSVKKKELLNKLAVWGKRTFVYTGRLTKGKGLEYLVLAWKKLVSEVPDIHLILVGSGGGYSLSCEEELRRFFKENHIEYTVTITGDITNVHEYLQAGDIFVLPSEMEGLSISLLEAMSCGLPCIVSSVVGNLDLIQDGVNGILVPYGDEEKLLEAMKEVLSNKEKNARLGSEARKTVVEKYNIDRIVDQYLSLS